jgi:phosphoglucosamine mutase
MAERLFGTDGVRGLAGTELTAELARALGWAAVAVLGRHGEAKPLVVVGRDPRESGIWLEEALVEGIRSAGGDVLLAGVQPTPAVAFLTTDLEASCGAVISASHNPREYNGIKFFGRTGYKLSDELEDEIESVLVDAWSAPDEADLVAGPRRPAEPGTARLLDDAAVRYLAHVEATVDTRLDGMRVVVDCANGAAFSDAPELLRRLGADVHPIYDVPDGTNINQHCGALHPEVVAAEVVRLGADAGVAHDGDADRALFADERGVVIDGDQVLAACAIDKHERGTLAGDVVVATVMANLGFRRAMQDAGIRVLLSKVGDRYVVEEMQRSGAALGGEQSGHLIFADHATTGDGLLTAATFLSLAARRGETLSELGGLMRRFPQTIVNVPVRDRAGLGGADEVWGAVRDSEAELGERGRVVVRASGTEPLVRVMVEAESEDETHRHAEAIAERVRSTLG